MGYMPQHMVPQMGMFGGGGGDMGSNDTSVALVGPGVMPRYDMPGGGSWMGAGSRSAAPALGGRDGHTTEVIHLGRGRGRGRGAGRGGSSQSYQSHQPQQQQQQHQPQQPQQQPPAQASGDGAATLPSSLGGGLGRPKVPRDPNTSTLSIVNIPRELNTIEGLNSHFKKFGTVVNLQVQQRANRASVQMASHQEALAALRSPEAVLNNRFIKVLWANKDEQDAGPAGGGGGGGGASIGGPGGSGGSGGTNAGSGTPLRFKSSS